MSFSNMLSIQDRRKLRDIVKRVHLRFYPVDKLTDYECDKFIDALSPELIENNLRASSKLGMD